METEQQDAKNKNDNLTLYDPIQAGLVQMEEKYKSGPGDLSNPEEYEACRLALADTRGVRGKTEKLRKELKADAVAYGKRVDGIAKAIIDKVKEIEAPYATAKKDYDTKVEIEKREKALAEERRVDGIYERIATINNLATANISAPAAEIAVLFPKLEASLLAVEEWAMEFADKAKDAIADAQQNLHRLHDMKVQQEQFEAEKAKAKAEEEKRAEEARVLREKEAETERLRLEKEREALERERAAIQAEKDRLATERAERERKEAEEKAERDRVAAVAAKAEQDRLAAEQAERDRIAKEQENNKEEQPAPSTDDMNQQYRNEAGRALMAITGTQKTAKALLDAIINGDVPHITFIGA